MRVRKVKSVWNGNLKEGKGEMSITGYSGPYTFATRFENAKGTNPEESIETEAHVTLGEVDGGPAITNIKLVSVTKCEGLSKDKFDELALAAKEKCPISRLYAGGTASIELDATLV